MNKVFRKKIPQIGPISIYWKLGDAAETYQIYRQIDWEKLLLK